MDLAYAQPDPGDSREQELSFARLTLLSQAYELHDSQGLTRTDLKEALLQYDSRQPLSVADYIDQAILTVCIDDPENQGPNWKDVLEEAIAERDKKKVFDCAGYLAQVKRDQPFQFGVLLNSLKEAFGKEMDYSLLKTAIANANRVWQMQQSEEKPDVADIARAWSAAHRDEWAYDHLVESWRHWNGHYWEVAREKGDILDHYVVNALQESGKSIDSLGVMNCFQRVAAAYCTRIFSFVDGKINFENGTLDLTTMQLMGHERQDGLTYMLPYCYSEKGTHPNITQFLEKTIPDAHARIVYQIHLGLSLMGDTNFHKFLILLGPTRSGKSTLLGLANALCGAAHFWDFAGPSLFARDLEGKRSRAKWNTGRMVCVDELPQEALMEEELLKAMTAHSGVEQRAIGKDERTDNRWMPKLMMSTNDTPHYKDTSGAMKQRALIIDCPNGPLPERQQDSMLFTSKLLPEIGAFASTCIAYARAAQATGYYPRSARMKEHLDRISSEGNPLRQFIEEECVMGENEKVTVNAFHLAYKEYCDGNHNRPLAKNKMTMAINDMHLPGIIAKHMRFDEQKLMRGFKGMRLRSVNEERAEKEREYDDDPLLTVVNGTVTVDFSIVNKLSEPVEPVQEEVLTMLTIPIEKIPIEDTSSSRENETYMSPICNIESDVSLTSLTLEENEPVERVERVDDTQNNRYSAVNSIVNTPELRVGQWVTCPAGIGQVFQITVNKVIVDVLGRHISYYGQSAHMITPRKEE